MGERIDEDAQAAPNSTRSSFPAVSSFRPERESSAESLLTKHSDNAAFPAKWKCLEI